MLEKVRASAISSRTAGTEELTEAGRQEVLLKAGALQNAILNSANLAIIATDETGVIQLFSVGAERMLGYTAAEVVNKFTAAELTDPQALSARAIALGRELTTIIPPGFEALACKAARGSEDVYALTYIRKDGSRFPAMLSVSALRNAQDGIIGYLLLGTDNSAHQQTDEAQHEADVAERLRAEAALRMSEKRYRTLFESIDEGFCIIEKIGAESGGTLDFRYIEANPAFAAQSGISGVVGKTLRQVIPDEFEEWLVTFDTVLKTGEPIRFERGLSTQGRVLELHAFRVEDDTHRRVAINFKDITQRRQTEVQLHQNRDTLFNFIENAPFGVYVVDAQFRMCQASAISLNVFSSVHPLIGRDFEEIVRAVWTDPFASEVLARFRHTLETGEPYVAPSTAELRKDIPDVESYDWKIHRITLPNGEFGVVCYFYDVTERKLAEDALRASEAFNRSIIKSSPDCIKVLDLQGNLLSMQSGQKLLGIEDIQPFLNTSWINFWEGEHRQAAQAAIALALAGGVGNFVGFFRTLRGEPKWWDVSVSPILDANGEPVQLLAVSRDVTERRQAELNFEFLALVSRDLLHLTSVDEMMQSVGAKVAAYLQLSICVFAEIDETAEQVVIQHDWHREDVPSLVGVHRLADFVDEEFIQVARAGEVIVVRDVTLDSRTDAEKFATLNITSFVCVPLIQDGQWRFALCLYKDVAYDWRADEIELARELTARIWTRLERLRAEAALRESEARFRGFVTASSDVMYRMSADWAEMRHLDGRNFIADTEKSNPNWLQEYISPDDQPQVLAAINESIRTKGIFDLEHRVRRVDGSVGWTSSRAVPLLDARGEIAEWFGAASDVTERKQAIEALRESEARFRAAVDTVSSLIWTNNADGLMEGEQPGWGNFTGQAQAEYQAYGWSKAVHPEDAQPTLDAWAQAVAEKRLFEFEHRLRRRDGEWRLCSIRAVPLVGDDGIIREWVGVHTDITERKRNEEAIRESEERYRNLFNSMDEGFCIIEMIFDAQQKAVDWRFLEVNPSFEKQSGVPEITGKRIRELAPDHEEYWFEIYGKVALTGEPVRFVNQAKAMEGRWFDLYAFRIGGEQSRRVAVLFTDITERKQSESNLKNAMASAEKANRAKSDFLSGMSHELRTPLNAILGFAQLIDSGTPPPSPSQKRSLDQILKGGWYLLDLINEILDLALIESGKVPLVCESVSLSQLTIECRAMIEPLAQARGIDLRFQQCETPLFVKADRTRVKQILLNLLSNAIKYNQPSGSVEVEYVFSPPHSIRICVRDTGAGLSTEQLAQLFQPFNRLGKADTEEGTGIGLVVTKRLVELMGGLIDVESAPGVGSVFWVELPQADAPQSVEAIADAAVLARPQLPVGAALRTLLYVEDNLPNMELVEQLIARRSDMRLLSAEDGACGIALARVHQPTVILMDVNLPGINGIQALKILREDALTAHIPVLAISANAMQHDIQKGLDAGFMFYLTKPIKVNAFMEALDQALEFSETG